MRFSKFEIGRRLLYLSAFADVKRGDDLLNRYIAILQLVVLTPQMNEPSCNFQGIVVILIFCMQLNGLNVEGAEFSLSNTEKVEMQSLKQQIQHFQSYFVKSDPLASWGKRRKRWRGGI